MNATIWKLRSCQERRVRSKDCQSQTNGTILQEWKGETADNLRRFRVAIMILKEQKYGNQDIMEFYTMDYTKTQEYLKIKGDQPEMKAIMDYKWSQIRKQG